MVQAADRMLHLKDGWFCVAALVVVFFLPSPCRGQSKMVGPSQPIVATIGDDIMLPCHLEPEEDVSHMTLEWTRPNLSPRFVYVWRDNIELEKKKHPNYKERTSLSINKLKRGDISLTLSKVKLSDEGTYRCFVPTTSKESSVELVVGSVSSPVIIFSEVNGELVLECKSKGWYPEPEVLWLDAEGNLLSAGPTETVRGPDDLYTVSSRVTVEKRHNNRFTCRVQQKNINQTRETHIQVSDDFFKIQSSSSPATVGLVVSLSVCIVIILCLVFIVLKHRHNIFKTKRSQCDETDEGEMKHLKKHLITKVRDKQAEVDQLSEENQRMKEELQTLNEELENKNQELKKIRDELSQYFKFSLDPRRSKLKKKKKEFEQEVETLKKKVETKETEIQTKTEQVHILSRKVEIPPHHHR